MSNALVKVYGCSGRIRNQNKDQLRSFYDAVVNEIDLEIIVIESRDYPMSHFPDSKTPEDEWDVGFERVVLDDRRTSTNAVDLARVIAAVAEIHEKHRMQVSVMTDIELAEQGE